jgi:hypothetical protein
MQRQRKASRHNPRKLTDLIKPFAMSGIVRIPRCANETVEKVRMIETTAAHRKMTTPNLTSPGNPDSADRKTSIQMKNKMNALAMYTAQ